MTLSSQPKDLKPAPLGLAPFASMYERIALLHHLMAENFGLYPQVAFELEFYLQGCDLPEKQEAIEREVLAECKKQNIGVSHYGKEDGPCQFEIALTHVDHPVLAADQLLLVRQFIAQAAENQHGKAIFDPKPDAAQPGSGLHLHISLHDSDGKNAFFKNDEEMSEALQWSMGGILLWIPYVMPVFAPHEHSYARFASKQNAPTTISWGANNRTTALRLPMKEHGNKHIEFRLPGSDAHPVSVLAVTLAAMHDGILRQAHPGPQIHGDASLEQYALKKIPASFEEAKQKCEQSDLYKAYFTTQALLTGTQ